MNHSICDQISHYPKPCRLVILNGFINFSLSVSELVKRQVVFLCLRELGYAPLVMRHHNPRSLAQAGQMGSLIFTYARDKILLTSRAHTYLMQYPPIFCLQELHKTHN